jgi:predicted DNA-binding transcriptional regulator AlpA
MNTKGVNFQPSKRGQFSAAVDISELTSMFGISRSTLFRTLKVLKRRESASV